MRSLVIYLELNWTCRKLKWSVFWGGRTRLSGHLKTFCWSEFSRKLNVNLKSKLLTSFNVVKDAGWRQRVDNITWFMTQIEWILSSELLNLSTTNNKLEAVSIKACLQNWKDIIWIKIILMSVFYRPDQGGIYVVRFFPISRYWIFSVYICFALLLFVFFCFAFCLLFLLFLSFIVKTHLQSL